MSRAVTIALWLHDACVAVLLLASVLMGAGLAATVIAAGLPPGSFGLPTSADTLHHGVLWAWPLLTTLLVGGWWRTRSALHRFAHMVLRGRNVWVGAALSLGVGATAQLLPAALIGRFQTPEDWAAALPMAVISLGLGTAAARWMARRNHDAEVGWPVVWRSLAMAIPLQLAVFGIATAVAMLLGWPGLALLSWLGADPFLADVLAASPPWVAATVHPLAVVASIAAGSLAFFWGIVQLLIPGHVFWRVVEHPEATGVGGASWVREVPPLPPSPRRRPTAPRCGSRRPGSTPRRRPTKRHDDRLPSRWEEAPPLPDEPVARSYRPGWTGAVAVGVACIVAVPARTSGTALAVFRMHPEASSPARCRFLPAE